MYTPPREIMIPSGSQIECIRTIYVGKGEGTVFTVGRLYDSPQDNCLVDNNGRTCFIQQDYLPYFNLT